MIGRLRSSLRTMRRRRALTFAVVAGVVVVGGAIAFAVLAPSTTGTAELTRSGCTPAAGSLQCHQFLGGETDVPVRLKVRNNGDPTDPAFERLSVVLGQGLMPVEAKAVRSDASSPEWESDVRDNLVTFTGGRVPGGTEQEFLITVDAGRFTNDVTGTWSAFAFYRDSPSGTPTKSTILAQTGSGLATKVRALQIASFAPTAPQGATDRTVTQGQQGVTITAEVRNRGGGAIGVTASLTCPSNATVRTPTSVSKTIPAGGGGVFPSETFPFVVDFADPGTSTDTTGQCKVLATAAGNTVAVKSDVEPYQQEPALNFTLQPKAGVSCQRLARNANEAEVSTAPVMPLGVQPNSAPDWTLRINKTGGQSLVLDGLETATPTKLVIAMQKGGTSFTYETPLESSMSLQGGSIAGGAVRLPFHPVAIDALMDEGVYTASLLVRGADGNGASLSSTLSSFTCADNGANPASIQVDKTAPQVVDLSISLPASIAWKTAVKDFDTVQVAGQVMREQVNGACPDIRANAQPGFGGARSLMREYDASGNVVAQPGVTLSVQPVAGDPTLCSVSGTPAPGYSAQTVAAELYLELEDSAGNVSTAVSSVPPPPVGGLDMFPCRPRLCVDTKAPSITVGRTGRHTDGTPNRVFAFFNEPLCAPAGVSIPAGQPMCGVASADWQVIGHVQGAGSNFNREDQRLELVLADQLQPNERPSVQYLDAARQGNNGITGNGFTYLFDRAGNPLPRSQVTALDGIAPLHPTLLTVDGQAQQQEVDSGGTTKSVFFTKARRPIFEFDGLAIDDIAEVFEDIDGNGLINADTDTRIAHCRVAATDVVPDSATLKCESSRTLRNERTIDSPMRVLIRGVDDGGNSSVTTPQVARLLVIDQTPPKIATAVGCVGDPSNANDDKIVVSFTENVVAGADFGPNFVITSPTRTYLVGEVGAPNDPVLEKRKRLLRQISPDWDADGPLTLFYELAPELLGAGRYQDRAGNEMADHSVALTVEPNSHPDCGLL